MSDLIHVMDTLVSVHGKILIPGIYDSVKDLTKEEKELYDPIDFNNVSLFITHQFWLFRTVQIV